MKTIISERIPGNHKAIKEIPTLIPFLAEGTSIEIDGMSYVVHNYSVSISGEEVHAHILVR